MTFKKQSIIAGILYISLVFIGPFTLMVFPEMFANQVDISSYVNENLGIVGLWITGDILLITIELFLTSLLLVLFKKVHSELSLFAFVARLLMIVVMVVNVGVLVGILNSNDLSNSLINWLFDVHYSLIYLWQVFFFIHLLLLGLLVLRSTVKRWIGYGLIIGSFAYLLDAVYHFARLDSVLFSVVVGILLGVVALSEIIFGIWLIFNKQIQLNK